MGLRRSGTVVRGLFSIAGSESRFGRRQGKQAQKIGSKGCNGRMVLISEEADKLLIWIVAFKKSLGIHLLAHSVNAPDLFPHLFMLGIQQMFDILKILPIKSLIVKVL